jgi:putative ABC transport system substrate-binding protein
MRRREIIALAGGAVVSPARAWAQKAPPKVGYLGGGTPDSFLARRTLAALKQGLAGNGMTDGRDYDLEMRFAEGNYDRFPELARELQQAGARIILPTTILAVRAAQRLTPAIPLVMPGINDPVGAGLVASLARPGGNTTGVATSAEDLTPKLLEYIRVLLPRAATLAVLYNPANPTNLTFLQRLQAEAAPRGLSLREFALKAPADLDRTFSALLAQHPDALQVLQDLALLDLSERIAELALARRLPMFVSVPDFAAAGALLGYGGSAVDFSRRAAYYVKRILDGAKPGDLPVEQLSRISLVINLRTARTMGLDVPAELLASADEMIE